MICGGQGAPGAAVDETGADNPPAYAVVTVTRRWAKVFWRLQGLKLGCHLLTVTIGSEAEPVDLVVLATGKVEIPR